MKNTTKNFPIRLILLIVVSLILAALVWIFHSFSVDMKVAWNLCAPHLFGGQYV